MGTKSKHVSEFFTVASKFKIECDLCETAIDDMIQLLKAEHAEGINGVPLMLTCSPSDTIAAWHIAKKYGFSVVVLPGIPDDYFALSCGCTCIYSPGA